MSLDETVKTGVDLDDKNFKSALSVLGNTGKGALSMVKIGVALDDKNFKSALSVLGNTAKDALSTLKMGIALDDKDFLGGLKNMAKGALSTFEKFKIGVNLDDKKLKESLDSFGNMAKNALSTVGTTMAGISTAIVSVSTDLISAGVAGVGMASQFENSMALTSTLFGDVNVNTDLLSKNMLALSSATGYTAKELGDNLYSAISAGVPVTQDMGEALEFMEKSSKLAVGTGTDLGTVVDSQTSIMNAYKIGTQDLDAVQKILIQTQNKGKTTVEELSQSLSNITPVAAQMSVGFDQVGASLATMTAQGTPTATATTQLKNLFSELGESGTQASEGLAQATQGTKYASKSFQELSKEGVPLNEILDLMKGYAEQNGMSFSDMFGSIEAGNAALSLSGENSETYASNLEAMSTSADVVGEAHEKMANNFVSQSEQAKEAFKNLGISIVQEQEGMLTSIGEFANATIGQLQTAFDEGGIQGLSGAIGGIFSTMLLTISENIPGIVQVLVDLIQSFIGGIGENLPQIVQSGMDIISSLLEGITSLLPDILEMGIEMIIQFSLGIVQAIPELIPMILTMCDTILNTLIDNIDEIIDVGILIITSLADSILSALPNLIEKAPIIIEKLVKAFVDNFPKLIIMAYDLIIALSKAIIENLPEIVKAGGSILVSIIQGIGDYISKIPGIAMEIISKFVQKFSDFDFIKIGKDIIGSVIKGIGSMVNEVVDSALNIGSSIFNAFKDFFGINSPAKKMIPIGFAIDEGVALGMELEEKNTINKAIKMANGVFIATQKTLDKKTGYFGNNRGAGIQEQSSIQSRMATENRKTNANFNLRGMANHQTQVTNAPTVNFKNTFNVSNGMDIAYVSQELGRQTSQNIRNTGVVMI